MKSRLGEDAKLTAGKRGQFDVITDGEMVFSKASVGRFPLEGEVEDTVARLKKGRA